MAAETYIVLFRGVGGKTQLPTKPLREALAAAGFRHVTTYIASGNAVLVSDTAADAVRDEIAAIAKREFSFAKDIMVASQAEWARLIAGNPYPEAVVEPTALHAFLIAAKPSRQAVEALAARAGPTERIQVIGRVLYFHAPAGFGVSKLPPLIDRTLGFPTTARNWNTVLKLRELADSAAAAERG